MGYGKLSIALAASAMIFTTPAGAKARLDHAPQIRELDAYMQCVPYAREVSGIQIYGDAHSWWDKAAGKYRRGNRPQEGAVMYFRPHRNMRLGHVAAVSRVIDARTVLLRHANWSPINGRRGHIEDDVRAIDVSAANDWSEVRVWYAPINDLGKTPWPVAGFIYPESAPARDDGSVASGETPPDIIGQIIASAG
jgi:surface antigen